VLRAAAWWARRQALLRGVQSWEFQSGHPSALVRELEKVTDQGTLDAYPLSRGVDVTYADLSKSGSVLGTIRNFDGRRTAEFVDCSSGGKEFLKQIPIVAVEDGLDGKSLRPVLAAPAHFRGLSCRSSILKLALRRGRRRAEPGSQSPRLDLFGYAPRSDP